MQRNNHGNLLLPCLVLLVVSQGAAVAQDCPGLGTGGQELCVRIDELETGAALDVRAASPISINQSVGAYDVDVVITLTSGPAGLGITTTGTIQKTADDGLARTIVLTADGGLSGAPLPGVGSVRLTGDASGPAIVQLGAAAGFDIGVGEPSYTPFPTLCDLTLFQAEDFDCVEANQDITADAVAIRSILSASVTNFGDTVTLPMSADTVIGAPGDVCIADPSFELGSPNEFWEEDPPLLGHTEVICSEATCPVAKPAGVDGDWFGWAELNSLNAAFLTQRAVIFPLDAVTLQFDLAAECDNGVVALFIDDEQVLTVKDPCPQTDELEPYLVDIRPFRGGLTHDIKVLFNAGTNMNDLGDLTAFIDDFQCQTQGPQNCGDGIPDSDERCDDGNTVPGDGCSDICLVEEGHFCTAAFDPNLFKDASFEAGSPPWFQGGIPFVPNLICTEALCGVPAPPGTDGDAFVLLGNIFGPDAIQSVTQNLVLPQGLTTITFEMYVESCDSPDHQVGFTTSEGSFLVPCVVNDGYETQTINVSGLPKDIELGAGFAFLGSGTSTGTRVFIDDVRAIADDVVPVPSQCARDCGLIEDFDPGTGSLPPGWTVFNFNSLSPELNWGTSDDGNCGDGENLTNGGGVAACVDSFRSGFNPGPMEAYLCSPELDFSGRAGSGLAFTLNYQIFEEPDPGDALEVLMGTQPPGPGTIGDYTPVFTTMDNVGELLDRPGVDMLVPIPGFDGADSAWLCLRYLADFDWYAQVDEVRATATACIADSDGDGVSDGSDNCTLVPNPNQVDTNGDGIGNWCDADLNGDCSVNFADLAAFKAAFFPRPYDQDADFNSDGFVNFADLSVLKASFFNGVNPGPGPSGLPNDCN